MKFEEMNLKEEILRAVRNIGFAEATKIQEGCIPTAMQGRDIMGQSSTGSGKTAAFGLPILEKIERRKGIQAAILTPTRELALQVKDNMDAFSQYLGISTAVVYGGVGIQPQIDALRTAEIVVATPGRMLDHIGRGTIYLGKVRTLVLDEADKMFEMGFIEDVQEIMKHMPKERQTMLFSATITPNVMHLVKLYLKNPLVVRHRMHVEKSLLKQVYYNLRCGDKFSLLVHLLKKKTPGLAIVFCGTRGEVDVVARNLKKQGVKAQAVHGGLSQNIRTHAVNALKQENIDVLVATDVAARGLDVNNISHVYNYDSPKTPEEYTHRIGRTARAGNYGEAVTLLCDRDHDNFRRVLADRDIVVASATPPRFLHIPLERYERQRRGLFRGQGGHGGPHRQRARTLR
jgi:ATP-dependent RNA helicase DeaD